MGKDVSNETVLVLAILAILVALLSVATVFFETSGVAFEGAQEDSSRGRVMLAIAGEPVVDTSQGVVSLTISDNNM